MIVSGLLPSIRSYIGRNVRRIWRHVNQLPSVSVEQVCRCSFSGERPIKRGVNLPPRENLPHDDFTPLVRIVKTVDPRHVLEIGTGEGNTTANVCAVSDAHVYTVNALPEQLAGDIVTYALSRDEIGWVYRETGYEDRVSQIYVNTMEWDPRAYIPEPIIDLAIIDGCHDREFVLNDFQKVRPLLREGAVVLFHDTHPSGTGHLHASYKACVELRGQGYNIVHLRGTWWGFWRHPQRALRPWLFLKHVRENLESISSFRRSNGVSAH